MAIENDIGDMMPEGLGSESEKDWPTIRASNAGKPAIDILAPNTVEHRRVLNYLTERLKQSEQAMSKFYARWRIAETKVQAYINLSDHEAMLKQLKNDKGSDPAMLKLIVPYGYSTTSTIVTYLIHVFAGKSPIFQIGSHKDEGAAAARMMELIMQYNADHTRLTREMFQFFQDGEVYGVSIMRNRWKEETKFRTVWRENKTPNLALPGEFETERYKEREERLVYAGNETVCIDPFMFFPDPRVPMSRVNKEGEWVGWREFHGRHALKRAEFAGELKWINHVGPISVNPMHNGHSARGLKSDGDAFPAHAIGTGNGSTQNFVQVDQMSIEIIPRELGIGDSEEVEKWIFTIGNKNQIIGAEAAETDHDMHPVAVAEPWSMGHGFGEASGVDYLAPMQDAISWMFNSHMDNVRAVLNNTMIVDPSMIEMQDLKRPGPGKIVRLKKAAQGRNIQDFMKQLQVHDVTASHVGDMAVTQRMADSLMAVNDNLRGQQSAGGRRSATEARSSMDAASSRLAAHAKKISAQGITDLSEQWSLNIQQYMDEDFFLEIAGNAGAKDFFMPDQITNSGAGRITPGMVAGDFHYPVHNGTLPMDKVALLDIWKELYLGILQDPQLRQGYDIAGMLEMIAEIGGAQGLKRFKIEQQEMPQGDIDDGLTSGDIVPGNTPGVPTNAGNRALGGVG